MLWAYGLPPFALSQFLVGVLLDRFGPRWTTAALFAVCGGGGGLLFAAAGSYSTVLIAMTLLGTGCAPVLMASVYIFKRSYDAHKFSTLASTFIALLACWAIFWGLVHLPMQQKLMAGVLSWWGYQS